jgi:NhaP-type Na+/H+ or K+/H+ antiporter
VTGPGPSLNRVAFSATVHCLTGCAIGEVLGMVIGTALGWGNAATIALAVVLAFFFGYALTMLPLLRAGMALGTAIRLAFASDTASMTSLLFWASLAFSLVIAGFAAFPVNRFLIARGRGHAVVHKHHGHH